MNIKSIIKEEINNHILAEVENELHELLSEQYNSQDDSSTGTLPYFGDPMWNLHEEDYHGDHRAPNSKDSPLYDVTLNGSYPDDIYTDNQALRYYGDGYSYDAISLAIIRAYHNKPNRQIRIYRAVPKVLTNQEKIADYVKQMAYIQKYGRIPKDINNWGNKSEYYEFLDKEIQKLKQEPQAEKIEINNGDWISITPAYVKEHGETQFGRGKFRVLSKIVPAKHVFTEGNSLHEWGYDNNMNEMLNEVGEANRSQYPFKLIKVTPYYKYIFTTEDGDNYAVEMGKNEKDDVDAANHNEWDAGFHVEGRDIADTINKGRIFQVMATVVAILKDFTQRENPDMVLVEPVKADDDYENDERRAKIYNEYIKKNLPNGYFMEYNPNVIFIIKNGYEPYPEFSDDSVNEEVLNENTYKVYHGTNEKFSNFDFKRATQGIVWFTDSIDSIRNQEHGGQGSKYIMTRYITINKPADWDEYEKYGLGQLQSMGYDGVILPQGNKTDYFVFSPKSISAKQ